MAKTSINYLFPPEKINELPTWRFILHFKAPMFFKGKKARQAIDALKNAEWKIVGFPTGFDALAINEGTKTLDIPIEVPDERRKRDGSLADYESDVWKIYGNVLQFGFGDLFYEAIDWKE